MGLYEFEGTELYEHLLAEGGVQVLPQVTVVNDNVEKVLQVVIGTTVAKVRELCGIPADLQGVVDDEPVADKYPLVRDCRLVFRPGVEESMAVVQATVVIGNKEKVLELAVGTTVAKVRERCGVPADWQGVLDDWPVVDNHPIVCDCRLAFRPSIKEAIDVLSWTISCHSPEDKQNWISFSDLFEIIPAKEARRLSPAEWEFLLDKKEELLRLSPAEWASLSDKKLLSNLSPEELETMLNGELRMLSEKHLKTFLKEQGVRYFNPIKQRLVFHCGDYCHLLVRQVRQRDAVLAAAADPKEILLSDAIQNLEAGFRRLYKRKKGGK
jgi:hypothetical protein